MNSRERVLQALNHLEPDMIPIDLGAGFQTGMHVQSVYKLRQALGLDEPGTPVKVIEPCQMLGEIKPDLLEVVGGDVLGVNPPTTMFGYRNEDWKHWTTFDGTPVLVPGGFNTEVSTDGNLYQYPEGDKLTAPSGVMPEGGFYFDVVNREEPINNESLKVEDNLEEFSLISERDLQYFSQEINYLYENTNKAIYVNPGGTAFGDIALVPAPWLKNPKGIRSVEEWYVSLITRKDYIHKIFNWQCQIGIENLSRLYDTVGNKIHIIFISGTDFGAQDRLLVSVKTYQELFMPYHKRLNDWIHKNTTWKTFMHTDGAIIQLIPSFIEAGFDILNPVQWMAKNMEPSKLKGLYGEKLVFWGGGVNGQQTLPFGSPDEVRREVKQRICDFAPGGGWIFNSIHNIQPQVPVENLLAMYETIKENRKYPIHRNP